MCVYYHKNYIYIYIYIYMNYHKIYIYIYIYIYILYLCCSKGPSHSVWWSLFVWRFFVGLTVFSP